MVVLQTVHAIRFADLVGTNHGALDGVPQAYQCMLWPTSRRNRQLVSYKHDP
jgi:hypothetical protein